MSPHGGEDKQTDKYTHTVEYYSAIKRNNLLTHVRVRKTRGKKSQSHGTERKRKYQRVTHSMVPFIRQNYRDRKQLTVARGWARENV